MNGDFNWLKKQMFLKKATTFLRNILFYNQMRYYPILQYKAPES